MPSKRRRFQRAFTLIEVAVAIAVIMISFGAVYGMLTMGLSISESSRENLRATQIMLDKMEGVRLYNWTQVNDPTVLISGFTNYFFETNNVGLSTATGYGIQYTGMVTVAAVPFTTTYSSSMRQVTVTVNWNSSGCGWNSGKLAHTRTMATYVAQQGMQNYIYNSN